MPQMAPALWLPLFITMIMVMLLLKTIIYFSDTPLSDQPSYSHLPTLHLTWLW